MYARWVFCRSLCYSFIYPFFYGFVQILLAIRCALLIPTMIEKQITFLRGYIKHQQSVDIEVLFVNRINYILSIKHNLIDTEHLYIFHLTDCNQWTPMKEPLRRPKHWIIHRKMHVTLHTIDAIWITNFEWNNEYKCIKRTGRRTKIVFMQTVCVNADDSD